MGYGLRPTTERAASRTRHSDAHAAVGVDSDAQCFWHASVMRSACTVGVPSEMARSQRASHSAPRAARGRQAYKMQSVRQESLGVSTSRAFCSIAPSCRFRCQRPSAPNTKIVKPIIMKILRYFAREPRPIARE